LAEANGNKNTHFQFFAIPLPSVSTPIAVSFNTHCRQFQHPLPSVSTPIAVSFNTHCRQFQRRIIKNNKNSDSAKKQAQKFGIR